MTGIHEWVKATVFEFLKKILIVVRMGKWVILGLKLTFLFSTTKLTFLDLLIRFS